MGYDLLERGLQGIRDSLNGGVFSDGTELAAELNSLHAKVHGLECECGLGQLDPEEFGFQLPRVGVVPDPPSVGRGLNIPLGSVDPFANSGGGRSGGGDGDDVVGGVSGASGVPRVPPCPPSSPLGKSSDSLFGASSLGTVGGGSDEDDTLSFSVLTPTVYCERHKVWVKPMCSSQACGVCGEGGKIGEHDCSTCGCSCPEPDGNDKCYPSGLRPVNDPRGLLDKELDS